jgi:heme oxygenase (mycobilin-producing)
MSITRVTEFIAAKGKEDELRSLLTSVVPYITSSMGCLSCEILRQLEKPQCFVAIERWSDIEAHKLCVAQFPKDKLDAAMRLVAHPPAGGYYQGS